MTPSSDFPSRTVSRLIAHYVKRGESREGALVRIMRFSHHERVRLLMKSVGRTNPCMRGER